MIDNFYNWVRYTQPTLMLIGLVFLQQIPTYIPSFSHISPTLVLGGVFYWSIYRPDLLPVVVVFLLGLFQDVMTSQMLGTNALVLVLVYGVCQWQRRFFFKRSFVIMWWGLMMVTVALSCAKWFLSMVVYGQVLSPLPVFFQVLSTIAVYPLVSFLCSVIHRFIPSGQGVIHG